MIVFKVLDQDVSNKYCSQLLFNINIQKADNKLSNLNLYNFGFLACSLERYL